MTHTSYSILILSLLLFASACANSSAPRTEITLEATDFTYGPASITVPAGQPVTLTINNTGKVEHDFVIAEINVSDVVVPDTGPAEHHQMGQAEYDLHFTAQAGETAVLQFTALDPGTYKFFCTIKGHEEAGMIGKMVVVNQ